MKNIIVTFILGFCSLFAHAECTKADYTKIALLGTGVVVGSAAVGVAVAATAPVAGTTAVAGSYFTVGAGSAAFGSWVSASVVPMAVTTASLGAIGASLVSVGYITEGCGKQLSEKSQKK